ncbi:hypothetical protein J6590_055879 [Homalodisca vitripennis]|nr:hypothetical protein J6590_055879 [Homalodisca vitripennis]
MLQAALKTARKCGQLQRGCVRMVYKLFYSYAISFTSKFSSFPAHYNAVLSRRMPTVASFQTCPWMDRAAETVAKFRTKVVEKGKAFRQLERDV